MKNWRIIAVLLLSLVLAGSVSCSPFGSDNGEEVSRQFIEVGRGDIMRAVTGDGNLSLLETRQLTFGTGGEIIELNVEEGERVAEGRVVGRLDTASQERAIKASELA